MNPLAAPDGTFEEPMTVPQIFFSFRGRIPRRAWWLYGMGALLGMAVLVTALLDIAGFAPRTVESVVNLLLLWPTMAVSIKRWHDRDKSAWWMLVALLPVIGWLWILVENGFMRGTPGPNRYGDDLAGRL